MAKTVFNKDLTLLKIKSGQGRGDPAEESRKTVRASVSVPGISLALRSAYAGQSVDLVAVIRRKDLEKGFNYAEYEGVRYRIESVNAAEKEMFAKLMLERG